MLISTVIDRPNISETVADAVRHMIVEGQLTGGERINEVHLSQQLGVSRTPLREALSKLSTEGALRVVPRIGYFVRELSLAEFEQIYAIRPILEPEALLLAGLPSAEQSNRLQSINRQIENAKDPDTAIELDDLWHLELIAPCPNSVLIDLVKQFMTRTRRYETALMREQGNVQTAAATHEKIMNALHERDIKRACVALRENLNSGHDLIANFLKSRASGEEQT